MTPELARVARQRDVVAEAIRFRCAYDANFVKLVKVLKTKARSRNAKEVVKLYVRYEILQQIKCHARMIARAPAEVDACACFACLNYAATSKCKCGEHLVCKGCEGYCD